MAKSKKRDPRGRKPMFDAPMTRLKVSIPKPMKQLIHEIGDGNYSQGVRRIVDFYQQNS